MGLLNDLGEFGEDAVDATVDVVEEGVEVVVETVEEVVKTAEELAQEAADLAKKAAEELAEALGDAVGDAGDWIEQNATDLAVVGRAAATTAASAYAGPIGGAVVGAILGGGEAAINGGDAGEIARGGVLGGLDGATAGSTNPIVTGARDFVHRVDENLQEGDDLGDAIKHAAGEHDLDALKRADMMGNNPLYEAGVHAGVEALKGGDMADIGGAAVGGAADGWLGGTVTGELLAGGTGGLATGLFNGESGDDLGSSIFEGVKGGLDEAAPGFALAGRLGSDLADGKPIDDVFIEAGKHELGDMLQHYGVDEAAAERLADIGGDVVTGIGEGKSLGDILLDVGSEQADKALGAGGWLESAPEMVEEGMNWLDAFGNVGEEPADDFTEDLSDAVLSPYDSAAGASHTPLFSAALADSHAHSYYEPVSSIGSASWFSMH